MLTNKEIEIAMDIYKIAVAVKCESSRAQAQAIEDDLLKSWYAFQDGKLDVQDWEQLHQACCDCHRIGRKYLEPAKPVFWTILRDDCKSRIPVGHRPWNRHRCLFGSDPFKELPLCNPDTCPQYWGNVT